MDEEVRPDEGERPVVALEDRDFRAFVRLIYDESGVRIGAEKREFLAARLRPLLRSLGEPTFGSLLRSIRGDPTGERLALLLDRVTTNTTGFFRHPVHFDILRARLPELVRARGRLRIWSAGCATGEEPYSAAVVAMEAGFGRDAKVLATDVSRRALRRASDAIYPAEALEQVPLACRRYFEPLSESTVQVRESVRALVTVRIHDLRELGAVGRDTFDVVFCRNVLIYFDANERPATIERLAGALRPGGIFFLGPCETGVKLPDSFARIGPAAYTKA